MDTEKKHVESRPPGVSRQVYRKAKRAKAGRMGPKADPDITAGRFIQKIRGLNLRRLERELQRTYQEAAQMNRVLGAYKIENEGQLPLVTSDEAPLALAIGSKFFYIAAELNRRGVTPTNDTALGGEHFQAFFSEIAHQTEAAHKETISGSFISRFAKKIRTVLRGR
jgi:hypothetical protein